MVGLPSFKTTSDFMKFCLKMHKKGRLVRFYRLNFSCFRTAKPWQDEEKFYSDLQSMLPNIPVRHWWEHRDENVAESCWKVPNIVDLKYNNKYWQVKETNEGTFYLYAAYFDVRKVHISNIERCRALNWKHFLLTRTCSV